MKASAENYAALFCEEQGSPERAERGVSGYRVKRVLAGDTLEIEGYAIWDNRQTAARARKQTERHREQVREVNRRNSQKRLRRLINENFGAGDLLLTLTYDPDRQPESAEGAQRELKNYLARMRRARKREGLPELKYVYTTETTHGTLGTRYHHHLIVNGGMQRETVEALWKNGLVNSRRARPDSFGLSGWAHYMSKHKATQEKACRRGWACSRNLRQPRVTYADHKLSRRRMRLLAEDMRAHSTEIFGRLYPDYVLSELPELRYSPYVEGVYLSARLIRRGGVTIGRQEALKCK